MTRGVVAVVAKSTDMGRIRLLNKLQLVVYIRWWSLLLQNPTRVRRSASVQRLQLTWPQPSIQPSSRLVLHRLDMNSCCDKRQSYFICIKLLLKSVLRNCSTLHKEQMQRLTTHRLSNDVAWVQYCETWRIDWMNKGFESLSELIDTRESA